MGLFVKTEFGLIGQEAAVAIFEVLIVVKVWWRNLRQGDHWVDPGVDGKIILGWIFGKWDVGVWIGWS
jgi:hypothetical protein